MNEREFSEAVEDYLKAIYGLQREGKATTGALANKLGVAPASVTNMLKKLAEMALVTYEPYHGVRLTEAGERSALRVVRHHRLVELFLTEVLELSWDRVHEEAHRWEHVISPAIEMRMDEILGHPSHDPHGAPIPRPDGEVPQRTVFPLTQAQPGQQVIVAQVEEDSSELLRYLAELTLYPGQAVEIVAVAPFEGPLTLQIAGKERVVGHRAAESVLVSLAPNAS